MLAQTTREQLMSRYRLVLTVLPALAVGILYEFFLGHRHDYAGHYMAGYGASLAAMLFCFRVCSEEQYRRWSTFSIVPMCIFCILLGTITELTIFNLAKFDEVDFCNQSIGAVLAAMATVTFTGTKKPPERELDYGLIVGIAFVGAGGCFAFA